MSEVNSGIFLFCSVYMAYNKILYFLILWYYFNFNQHHTISPPLRCWDV